MTTRAQLFADNFQAATSNIAHIYQDGFILMIACSPELGMSIIKTCEEIYPVVEYARSADDFQLAIVLPIQLENESPNELARKHFGVCGFTQSFNDHRWSDAPSLECAEDVAHSLQALK